MASKAPLDLQPTTDHALWLRRAVDLTHQPDLDGLQTELEVEDMLDSVVVDAVEATQATVSEKRWSTC